MYMCIDCSVADGSCIEEAESRVIVLNLKYCVSSFMVSFLTARMKSSKHRASHSQSEAVSHIGLITLHTILSTSSVVFGVRYDFVGRKIKPLNSQQFSPALLNISPPGTKE